MSIEDISSGRPRRRRRRNVRGGRHFAHQVKVSPEEEGQLQRLALDQGVSVPRLMVEATLSPLRAETASERAATASQLMALTRTIAAVGRNVNQLAKVANATGTVPPDIDATLAAIRRALREVDDVVDRAIQ